MYGKSKLLKLNAQLSNGATRIIEMSYIETLYLRMPGKVNILHILNDFLLLTVSCLDVENITNKVFESR